MSTVLIRSFLLYIVVIFAVRLMGKRQLGELQPSELVITILISNIATLPLEDLDIPLVTGILPILSLVSWITLKSKRMRRMISGSPKIIIRDGKIEQETLQDLRFSVDDLMTALRANQIFTPDEVQFAIVETTGSVSVYPKAAYRTVTQEDMKIKQASQDPPVVVIADGCLISRALDALHRNRAWLDRNLRQKNLAVSDVFLMLADQEDSVTVIPKERKHAK